MCEQSKSRSLWCFEGRLILFYMSIESNIDVITHNTAHMKFRKRNAGCLSNSSPPRMSFFGVAPGMFPARLAAFMYCRCKVRCVLCMAQLRLCFFFPCRATKLFHFLRCISIFCMVAGQMQEENKQYAQGQA